MTTIQKVKSVLYFCVWIFIVVGFEFLWLAILPYYFWDTYLYYIGIPIVFGIFIGLLSGFPPRKAFLVGFLGNFLFAVSLGFLSFLHFSSIDYLQLSILLGLMAIAGAVIRRVLSRDFKELYLSTKEWVILLGGCSAYADYIIFPTFDRIFEYQNYFQFFTGVLIVSISMFALGLYAGAFFNKEYNPIQKIKEISLAGHTGFILYTILIMFMGAPIWETCLFYSFAALFFVVLLAGAKIGRKYS
ncbi:MAG: hypothetical protein PVF58_02175 [Candidatus Methanofastidiosia archaeon]|jgi:hypothetical protein